jgi:formimidoylglutamate deiminase
LTSISIPQKGPQRNQSGDAILDAWIFSAGNALVDCVWSGGRKVVQGGRHGSREGVAARLAATMRRLCAA